MNTHTKEEVIELLNVLESLIFDTLNENNNNVEEIDRFNRDLESIISMFEFQNRSSYLELKIRSLKIKLAYEQSIKFDSNIIKFLKESIEDYETQLGALNNVSLSNSNNFSVATSSETKKNVLILADKKTFFNSICYQEKSDIFEKEFLKSLRSHAEILCMNGIAINSFDVYANLTNKNQFYIDQIKNVIALSADLNDEKLSSLETIIAELSTSSENISINYINNMVNLFNTVYKDNRSNNLGKPSIALFNEASLKDSKFLKLRFIELSRKFHPDKNSYDGCAEFFCVIRKCYDYLSQKIYSKQINSLEYTLMMDAFEQKGDEYCNIAIDYYNRSQGKPGLKCLNPIDLANLTKEELTNQAKHYSYLSFNEYMNACKLADKLCASDKQLLFRHKMAMAQYISENMLEAQLICIAQIFMMNKFRHKKIPISGQATVNLDTIIRKIERKCKGLSMRTDKPADEKVFDKNQITANEVKDLVVYEASEDAEKNIEDKFKNSIILLLNKDRYNTKIALSKIESNINSIHSSIRNCQIATFSSTAFAVVQGAEIYLSWGTIAASGLFVGSLFILGAFITSYGTYYLWNNRRGMLKNEKKKYEASIKLNEILNNVFSYYKNEQFDKLLEELTRSYEDGKSLISFNKYTIRLDPTSMAEELLDYEFPPDGIAYIFNLIATVLFSGKVKPRGNLSENDFQMKAKELLSYVADEKSKLFEKCKELNENMKKINWRYGYFFHKQHIDSKIEYHNNLIKITEAQFIAKVNLILLTIAMNGLNIRNEEIIKNMLNDLDVFAKDKANFVDISTSSCLELVQFIFSVFNIEMPTKEESFKKKEDFDYDEKGINIIYEQKELLRFLTIRIENEKEQKCKGHQYVARATVYHDIALGKLKAQFDQHKFFYFNKARKDFEEAFTLNNDEMKTRKNIFMYLNCLVYLKRFSEVKEFIKILQANGNVDIDDEIYFYYGITERNMQNYKDAFQYFRMALIKFKDVKNDEKTKECLRELEIARSLQNESKTQQLSQIYETDFERFKILGEQVFAKKNSNKFRIISIDGGGVRGIIPAMILREIQRRLSYPLVSVVDMFAGTSTGAILAAGLNVPIRDGSRIPKYSPNDMFNFYIQESKNIFTRKYFICGGYEQKNLINCLQKKIHRQYNLSDMINHVLIPTSTEQKTLQVFSKDECETTRHDYCLVDVLTAATAAPTYFPAFRVDGIQHDLMDGGLLANNPARLAYNHAVNDLNKDKNDIYVISLGTGIDIGSVFNEKKSNSVLFWAQNISDFMIESHQNAVDQEMNDLIGDRYIKLQAYFSKPISLDACGKIGDLENIGKQVIEENTKLIDEIVKILQN